jgi:hypothetical protein
MPSEGECRQAAQFRDDFWLNLMYVLQLFFTSFAATTVLWTFYQIKWSKMSGIFNANLKTLLLVGAVLILYNAIMAFCFYAYMLVGF